VVVLEFFSTNNSAVGTVNSTTGVVSGISAGTATVTYTVTGSGGCVATATRTVTVVPAPSALTISPASATICNGDIQSLVASGGLAISSSVQSLGASASISAAAATGATLGPNPFQDYYGGAKQQMLFNASELSALGITNGSIISSISFNMSAVGTRTLQNYVVKMKNTSTTSFGSTTFETGLTTVRTAGDITPVLGWNSLDLTSNFTYTGQSLLIEINFSNNDSPTSSLNRAFYDATSFTSTLFYRADSQTATVVDQSTVASFNPYSQRNSIRFSVSNSEQGTITWSPATALYTNAAATTSYTGDASATVYAKPTETITYTATATAAQGCTSSNTVQVTVTAAPSAGTLSGTQSICSNGTTTFSSSVSGGSWTSDNTNIATINSSTGVVTPVSAGTATMTYTVTGTGGCSNATATRTVTIASVITYYADADGDSFGNASVSTSACSQPVGYVTDNTDCDDNNASIKPAPFGLEV